VVAGGQPLPRNGRQQLQLGTTANE